VRGFALIALAGCAQVWGIDKTLVRCEGDQIRCGETCVDPFVDRENCGGCDNACTGADVCANGTCALDCPIDLPLCGSTCSDLMTDAANCGACGRACSETEVCNFGECEPACDASMLNAGILDPWGVRWDGLERAAAALDAAEITCKAFGARLPTATELYRVSATQGGAVGMSFHTSYLWSKTPNDDLEQAVIRLSDGATSSIVASTPAAFRCVCGVVLPRTFTSGHCNGAPGDGCFEVNGYHVDKKDRPALRKSAAVQECVSERAHLVSSTVLVEAIRAGLPGTNAFVTTADQARYDASTQLRWMSSAGGATWQPDMNVQMIDNRTPAPFRCAASKLPQSPTAIQVSNAFVPTISKYTGETVDTATTPWAIAHDSCFTRGGHLPRSAELAELIQQGMPGGTNMYLWTSDQVGFNGTQFLSTTQLWTGLARRYNYAYTGGAGQTATWDYKTTMHPFRCIYYPIDPTYAAPTSCVGGCFAVTLPGSPAAHMWFDSMDRPLATPGAAFDDCNASGGHLASERDLTEAIRSGLPNGTAAMTPPWLWTSDFAQNNLTVVKWTGVEMTFDDQYSNFMTWAGPTNMFRYRCMWTDEIR
jgi:hypothetical protein